MKKETEKRSVHSGGAEGGVGSVRKMLGAEKRGQRGGNTWTRRDEKKTSRAAKGRGTVSELHYYTRKTCDERRRYGTEEGIHNADPGTNPLRRAVGAPVSKVNGN